MSEKYLPLCTCGCHVDLEIISELWIIECLGCGNSVTDTVMVQCINKWKNLIERNTSNE